MDISSIERVYNGKLGCMCGCMGKYSSPEDNARSVKIIAKKVLTNPNVVYEGNYALVEDQARNKMQVVFFK